MTVYRYMVWDDASGTAAARPFVRFIVCDSDLIADQPLAVGEAYDVAPDTFTLEEDDDVTDLLSFVYTVDTTVDPKTVTAVSSNRFTLTERQDIQNRKVERLLTEAVTQALRLDTRFTEAQLTALVTYTDALRAVPAQPGFPDTITWPTKPSFVGSDADTLLTRSYRWGNVLAGVNFSGGIPNGGLFETGSNANGRFIRFADGFQICHHNFAVDYIAATALGGTWTFPAAFATVQQYSVTAIMSTVNNGNTASGLTASEIEQCQLLMTNRTATTFNVQVRSPTYSFGTLDICHMNFTAVGRWAA